MPTDGNGYGCCCLQIVKALKKLRVGGGQGSWHIFLPRMEKGRLLEGLT